MGLSALDRAMRLARPGAEAPPDSKHFSADWAAGAEGRLVAEAPGAAGPIIKTHDVTSTNLPIRFGPR